MTDANGNSMVMPVAPYYGGNGGGFGFGGDSGWWIILLLICLGGGWGGGFGFGGAGGMFPWMNTNNDVQRGFDQTAVMTGLNGVQNAVTSGFGDIQTALCGGFAGVNAGIANGFAQSEIAANARQIADMQQNFAAQTATLQGFNGLQGQLASCCCDNRAGLADLKYAVATENCADRSALSDGVRDIIANQNAGIQAILDKMCADKIDAKNEKIVELNNKINSLESNNYIQNALTAQTQYFLQQYPPTATATRVA